MNEGQVLDASTHLEDIWALLFSACPSKCVTALINERLLLESDEFRSRFQQDLEKRNWTVVLFDVISFSLSRSHRLEGETSV